MVIINGTSHAINIYSLDGLTAHPERRGAFLKGDSEPVQVIPAGIMLNAQKENAAAPSGDYGVPVVGATVFTGADPIPEGDLVVVSQLYRSACKELGRDTARLATVSGPVYEEGSPRPCGCTALSVG